MERGYQKHFYKMCQKVRDPVSRQRQALKIAYALTHYTDIELSQCVALDIGCSSGLITFFLSPLFYKTIGLEYDEDALKAVDPIIRSKVHFIQGDAVNLPLRNEAINVVICAQVYEHVPNPEKLLSEIYRVLSPRGVVFFSGPNWLFPIEPHYSLPFLHWLPAELSNIYLRLTGQGNQYYERMVHYWGLRRLVRRFKCQDITIEVLQLFYIKDSIFRIIPKWVWKILLPFFPSFNFILHKPAVSNDDENL